MDGPMQQNPDGSWSEAQPLGWQGSGIDWEVYGKKDGRYRAEAYDEDVLVHVAEAHTRIGLTFKMRRAHRRLS